MIEAQLNKLIAKAERKLKRQLTWREKVYLFALLAEHSLNIIER